jgi:hypothetical protein
MDKIIMSSDSLNEPEFMAWYMYPEPHGKIYTRKDLESLTIVEELFDYCQILLAFINRAGWQFLVQTHGIEQLLTVNKISGWFSTDTPQDAFDDLRYNCSISGYDPVTGALGSFDEETGIFSPECGGEYSLLWGEWHSYSIADRCNRSNNRSTLFSHN